MTSIDDTGHHRSAERLADWYDATVRGFLERWAPASLPRLDDERLRLRNALSKSSEVPVCFLGSAGIGKSTLLNAVVAGSDRILPAGGYGPLTAQAIRVRSAATPAFTVRYHGPGRLWRLLFGLEFAARQSRESDVVPSADEIDEAGIEATQLEEIKRKAEMDVSSAEAGESANEAAKKQAKQLVRADQFASIPLTYLIDALRSALGKQTRFDTALLPEDQARIESLARAVQAGKEKKFVHFSLDGDRAGFLTSLDEHAAGHLAPIIDEIEVQWQSDALAHGVTFVDLPGVGIAGDSHKGVTRAFVSEQARSVVLVVDRAGITESIHDLLSESGFWARLLASADDPERDPCSLVIAVTRVDDVADAEWEKVRGQPKEQRPRREDILRHTMARMEQSIHQQAGVQFARLSTGEEGRDLREAREAVARRLLADLRVFPVSAPEYGRVLLDDPDVAPRLAKKPEDTGIPQLRAHIRDIACATQQRRRQTIERIHARFVAALQDELLQLRVSWEDEQRTKQEVERLEVDLEALLVPLRTELATRKGAFREFLQETASHRIGELVAEAREEAERDVRRYLRSLQDAHWASLRAAVVRGGAFIGSRHIDIPGTIADKFQEPMAGVWGVKLLKDVRKRTGDYADDCAGMVGEVAEWAKEQGARVDRRLVESLERRMRANAEQLREIGTEATDELRKTVKSELYTRISGPIKRGCDEFVQKGDAAGRGVKQRILDLFSDLAETSTKAATAPARKILVSRFEEVKGLIGVAFEEWQDPLDTAKTTILGSHSKRIDKQAKSESERFKREYEQSVSAAPEQWDQQSLPEESVNGETDVRDDDDDRAAGLTA